MDKKPLDEKDKEILWYLWSNAHASVGSVASHLEMPIPTAQKRVQRLLREGYLERLLRVVDLRTLGYESRYRIDININPRELRHGEVAEGKSKENITTQEKLAAYIMSGLAKQFGSELLIENVTILLGHRADLSAIVWVKNAEVLRHFVTDGLRRLGGIQNTNTALEAWSVQEALHGKSPRAEPANRPPRKRNKR